MTEHQRDPVDPERPATGVDEAPAPWLGDSRMAERVREFDWSVTPLGPLDEWPASLRTTVGACLRSRFPTALWWGPDLIAIYNDGYAAYLGPGKHPAALGRPYRAVWSEIWEVVEASFAALFENGEATWREDQRLTVERNGYPEEAFFTYSLSPVIDETGEVAGALNVVVESTDRVLANRRIRVLQRASAATAGATTVKEAGHAIARELAEHQADLPFAALYRVEGETATLIGSAHLEPGSRAAPHSMSVDEGPWPMALALKTGEAVRVDDLDAHLSGLPGGPWPEPARQALVLPLDRGDLRGALVAGISPRRASDREYHHFLTSLRDALAAALADAAAQERERASRIEAEEANRAKSEFLTAMSHELRTPLNAIGGYVDLLDAGVHGELTDAHRQALHRIVANQRHLLTLINDILLFARIEAARLEFRADVLDATELVESLEPLIHPLAVRKGVDYTLEECEEPLRLRGDRERVRQILLNLTTNAIKFTPKGGEITVVCGASDDGEQIEFRVSDSGPGIAPGQHEQIFDPFSQVERRLDSPREGAGLGLPISRDMARGMGGDITVDSEPGQGAVFRVFLPRVNPSD